MQRTLEFGRLDYKVPRARRGEGPETGALRGIVSPVACGRVTGLNIHSRESSRCIVNSVVVIEALDWMVC